MWKRADDEVRSLVARLMCESGSHGSDPLNRSENGKRLATEAASQVASGTDKTTKVRKADLTVYETDERTPVLHNTMPHRPKNTV